MTKVRNCLYETKIYVGTYKKYNEGSLFGQWLNISDYNDFEELIQAMRKLHQDEEDPEFMFQDYECSTIIENMGLIGESYISSEIYEVLEAIEASYYREEVIEAYVDCYGTEDNIHNLIRKVEESYTGKYNTDQEFVEELLEQTGDIPENLPSYIHIDWESTTRNIMYDYSTSNNHYFRDI
ncbi:antirestriction protein ArdA [Apibacter muscae]|uniref:antirestriction protein ArdA n=1 Tax=Apibacter muscae TaxID=2509004 RepID=UPI0011ADD779|nr:antirestriction protein ArdA [Apibacter muscae]TWP31591.1 antirestriction protein ArdA [Apibacter muscae]